jgi:ABC-type spermidine/putrescine transport system permease subunit II
MMALFNIRNPTLTHHVLLLLLPLLLPLLLLLLPLLLLLLQSLCSQTVELVFTAHPTQAFRQSLLKKYARVRGVAGSCCVSICGQFCCME